MPYILYIFQTVNYSALLSDSINIINFNNINKCKLFINVMSS